MAEERIGRYIVLWRFNPPTGLVSTGGAATDPDQKRIEANP